MKKIFCALTQNLLKIVLLFYIILLFSLVAVQENVKMSYAMSLHSLQALASSTDTNTPTSSSTPASTTTATATSTTTATPTSTTTATPTSTTTATPTSTTTATPTSTTTATPTPTPTPTPAPKPASTQQQAPTPPQVGPQPITAIPTNPTTTENPTTATPVSTPQSATPITIVATPTPAKTGVPIPTPPHLQNTKDNGINAFTLSLTLGLAAPLLMLSAGGLWLLVKWLIKRQRPAREQETQISPWVNSSMQAPLHALQSASGAVLNTTMPYTNTLGTAPISTLPVQPTYTASDLRPITQSLPQQMLTLHSNGITHYPPNGDLQPLPIHSPDLSLEVTRAIESNGNGYMPFLPDTPTGLADTPTSSMPSSPPRQGVSLLPSSTIQQPAAQDDSPLASMMHQAQIGLFALLGREKSLVH